MRIPVLALVPVFVPFLVPVLVLVFVFVVGPPRGDAIVAVGRGRDGGSSPTRVLPLALLPLPLPPLRLLLLLPLPPTLW